MDPTILDDLRRDYDAENLIVFVGAGVSAAAGLPGWKRLAEMLLERARARGADAGALEEMEEFIRTTRLVEAISAAKLALGVELERAVRAALDDKGRDIPAAAHAIAALRPKLRAVVTTNLDRLLERAFSGEWEALTDPTGDIAQRRGYIWKVHGTLSDSRTWVFLRDQYDRAMYLSPLLQDTMSALYRSRAILFVGFGLADDNIDITLGKVRAQAGGQPPSHYALMPAGMGPMKRRALEDAGIRLLLYETPGGSHAEVERVLRSLAAPAPVSAPIPAPAAPLVKPADDPAVTRIFISFDEEDRDLLVKLEKHLKPLTRDGSVVVWHAEKLAGGADVEETVRRELDRANVILLLTSHNSLASDKIDAETARAMELSRAGAAVVMPVLLQPCQWETSRFHKLVVFPKNKKPIVTWPNQDQAFLEIVTALRDLLKKRVASR